MSDIETIDVGTIAKSARKLYPEKEFRQRYNKLDYGSLTPKQREAFNLPYKFLSVRAGNRSGKTTFAMHYAACALLGRWPKWYTGFKFVPPNIARSVTFNCWIIGPTGVQVRDTLQASILGGLTKNELGTGWLPLSSLRNQITTSRGVSGLADTLLVTRDDGTLASVSFKTWEMSRDAFQGSAVDLVIADEDPGKPGEQIWPELIARIVGTGGRIIHTATPLAGPSSIRKFFKEQDKEDRGEIRMSIYDNQFLSEADIKTAEGNYSVRERATRLFGDDLPGQGAVFNFTEDTYLHDMKPEQIPTFWKWNAGMDFSHGGLSSSAHPWAYVCCAIDPASDTVYVMHALRIKQQLPANHVSALKHWNAWDAQISYGMDGAQRSDAAKGTTYTGMYKQLGLPMRGTHATLKDGSVSLEGSIGEMERMFSESRLKIARHLVELREEIREYAYDKDGVKPLAEADDLVSALRYAVMDRRYARPLNDGREYLAVDPMNPYRRRRSRQGQIAEGTNFDPFDPGPEED